MELTGIRIELLRTLFIYKHVDEAYKSCLLQHIFLPYFLIGLQQKRSLTISQTLNDNNIHILHIYYMYFPFRLFYLFQMCNKNVHKILKCFKNIANFTIVEI